MSTPEVGAVVVGGGAAGLAAALELQRHVSEVVLVDPSDRPGGVMRTDHVSGFVVERGPNTFLVSAPMLELCRREGLESSLVRAQPASRIRLIYHDGALVRAPMSPLGLARSPLLSARGKLRLLMEPFPRRRDATAETVAEFVGRRMGSEVVSGLVGPFLTGIYAGDEDELGAAAVFRGLVDLERRFGSIFIGGGLRLLGRKGPRGLRGSHSAAQGVGPFARALTERLLEPPALGSRVTGIRRDEHGWTLNVSGAGGESRLRAARVVIATPAREAGDLLRVVDTELAAGLESIDYAPVVSIPFGVDADQLPSAARGFGFLVPRQAGLQLLGCLFMSQLFPDRAPAGRELLQCLLGGRRWPEAVELPDDVLVSRMRADLEQTLGLRGEAQPLGVMRWPRGIPQPGRDHVRRIAAVRERLRALPGLALAGSYLDGVSVSDAFASGSRAAGEVLAAS